MPAELSGGMRKRVGLARAIVGEPEILLYDEPVTGLDPVNAAGVDQLITDIAERTHVTSVVVTHDVEGALAVCDRDRPAGRRAAALRGHPRGVPPQRGPAGQAFADRKAAAIAAREMEAATRGLARIRHRGKRP